MGPGIANLFTIAQACDSSVTAASVAGLRYGDFKKLVAEAVIARLEPIQNKYAEVTKDPAYLDDVLRRGWEHTMPIAQSTIQTVKKAMGLYVPKV
jgi:tryptophanyl-tRNA synthetase